MNYYLHGSLFPYTFTHLIFFIESVKPQNIMTPKSVSVFINVIKKKRPWQICNMKSTYNILVYVRSCIHYLSSFEKYHFRMYNKPFKVHIDDRVNHFGTNTNLLY